VRLGGRPLRAEDTPPPAPCARDSGVACGRASPRAPTLPEAPAFSCPCVGQAFSLQAWPPSTSRRSASSTTRPPSTRPSRSRSRTSACTRSSMVMDSLSAVGVGRAVCRGGARPPFVPCAKFVSSAAQFPWSHTPHRHPHTLTPDLEWKLIYVGSAESEKYDQVLDSVLVGPVYPGQYRFVFQVRRGELFFCFSSFRSGVAKSAVAGPGCEGSGRAHTHVLMGAAPRTPKRRR